MQCACLELTILVKYENGRQETVIKCQHWLYWSWEEKAQVDSEDNRISTLKIYTCLHKNHYYDVYLFPSKHGVGYVAQALDSYDCLNA